jgi:hypothetical protein
MAFVALEPVNDEICNCIRSQAALRLPWERLYLILIDGLLPYVQLSLPICIIVTTK